MLTILKFRYECSEKKNLNLNVFILCECFTEMSTQRKGALPRCDVKTLGHE